MIDVKKIDVKKAEKYGWKVEEDRPDKDFIYLLKTGDYYLADNCNPHRWELAPHLWDDYAFSSRDRYFDEMWVDDVAAYYDPHEENEYSLREIAYCDEDFARFFNDYNLTPNDLIYVENEHYILKKGLYTAVDFYNVLPAKEDILEKAKDTLDEDEYEEFEALAEESLYSAMEAFEYLDLQFMNIFSIVRRVPMKEAR